MAADMLAKEDLSGNKIFTVPDTLIIKIVKEYVRQLSHNVNLSKRQNINIDIGQSKRMIIDQIDNYYNSLMGWPKKVGFPTEIDDYIIYMVRRVVETINKDDPDTQGFTPSTIRQMTDLVKSAYQPMIDVKL